MFPSNWELSGARAARVVRMFETMGFDRRQLQAIGYADTKPLVPNRDAQGAAIPQNQAQNRRVVLRVIRDEQQPVPGGI
jgi:chemotaxis protein MotB